MYVDGATYDPDRFQKPIYFASSREWMPGATDFERGINDPYMYEIHHNHCYFPHCSKKVWLAPNSCE